MWSGLTNVVDSANNRRIAIPTRGACVTNTVVAGAMPGRMAKLLAILPLRKSGPKLAGWHDNPPQTPMRRRGYTAFGGACFRGAGPGSMAQTSARRSIVTRTGRRRRASEDVARETFCSTCSPRFGGNNTGYVATVQARLTRGLEAPMIIGL